MRRLPITGIVLLVLLVGFGSLAMLSSWGPAVHAQGERQKEEALSNTLALLAMTLAKDPEVSGVLGAAFGAGVEIGQFINMVVAELQARPDLSSVQDLYNVLADQEKFTPLIREIFKAAIVNNGGDVTKVESQIDAFTPNIQGFQITALEQVPDQDMKGPVEAVILSADTSRTDDGYWDGKVDDLVGAVRRDILGDAAFEDVAILARTIAAYTKQSADEIINGDEATTLQAIQEATKDMDQAYQNLLNAALRRVRSLRLASLIQQVDRLATALAQTNKQLDAIQGELEALKGRRDPLPLVLAILALILALGALGLTVLRRRTA
jgi:hypothetical protein